jgi:hypothetical protein
LESGELTALRPKDVVEELEIRFIAQGKRLTCVELEHRKLERYGARPDEMREIFDKTGNWGQLLALFCAFGGRNDDMTNGGSIKLFQFPRMFGIPNLSPFCSKSATPPSSSITSKEPGASTPIPGFQDPYLRSGVPIAERFFIRSSAGLRARQKTSPSRKTRG